MTVAAGAFGACPNVDYRLGAAELPAFAEAVGQLRSETDCSALAGRWAVPRTDPQFWPFGDAVMARHAAAQPRSAAVLDDNRYENR